MTDPHPVQVTNLGRYGSAELPWSRPRDLLAVGPPGPPPWQLYRFNLHTAFGVATARAARRHPMALRVAVNAAT